MSGCLCTSILARIVVPSIVLLTGSTGVAWADGVPQPRVQQVCRGIALQSQDPLGRGEPAMSFADCVKSEEQERAQLSKEWSQFSANDKRHCVAESQMGGEASYTELITCLEMARDVRSMRSSSEAPPLKVRD